MLDRHSRRLVWNSQAAATATGFAFNADVPAISQASEDGWLQLSPYGETDYWQEEGGKWKKYTQVFQRDQARKMVTAFNAAAGKRGPQWRGLPVFIGHPDADPKRWNDERRIGAVQAMEDRADGLYVKVAWNDVGEQNRAQGYYIFPSPAWLHDRQRATSTCKIVPDELRSVGLVNSPRIPDVHAWTNSDQSAATEDTGRVAALTAELARAQADTARYRAVASAALLDVAINEGRLTAAERPGYERSLATNFEETLTNLRSKASVLPAQKILLQSVAQALGTPAQRRTAYNARVDELMNGQGLTFEAATREMRTDPVGWLIVEAMERADLDNSGTR